MTQVNNFVKAVFIASILGLILLTSAQAQVELKGVTIGDTYNGNHEQLTSVGGVHGLLSADTLNDGTVYQIVFTPTDDGNKVKRIYNSDAMGIVKGIASKYKTSLDRSHRSDYMGYNWKGSKKGVNYLITIEDNEFIDPPCKLTLVIYNEKLYKTHKQEKQTVLNSDF